MIYYQKKKLVLFSILFKISYFKKCTIKILFQKCVNLCYLYTLFPIPTTYTQTLTQFFECRRIDTKKTIASVIVACSLLRNSYTLTIIRVVGEVDTPIAGVGEDSGKGGL